MKSQHAVALLLCLLQLTALNARVLSQGMSRFCDSISNLLLDVTTPWRLYAACICATLHDLRSPVPSMSAQPGCALYFDGGGDVSLSAQGSRAGRCLQAQLQQLLQPHQAKLLQPPLPQPPQQASHCPTSCDVHACASTTGQHFTCIDSL